MLLDALSAMGLLEKTAEAYSTTPESLKYLSKDSPAYIGYMILHHHNLVDSLGPIWTKRSKPAGP